MEHHVDTPALFVKCKYEKPIARSLSNLLLMAKGACTTGSNAQVREGDNCQTGGTASGGACSTGSGAGQSSSCTTGSIADISTCTTGNGAHAFCVAGHGYH